MVHLIQGGSINNHQTFNADTGSLYATRASDEGTADSTRTSVAFIDPYTSTAAEDHFNVGYSCWISGEEKLGMWFHVNYAGSGAGTAPSRREQVYKYVPSPLTDTCDSIENDHSGNLFATDSNCSALGSDLTPAAGTSATISEGAIFHETDTNISYVLYNGSWTAL